MQTTSQTWRELWAAGAPLEARATVNGTVYEGVAPEINRAAMQDSLSVGNVVAASMLLSLRGAVSVPRSAAVAVEVRLNDGETASEWLPQGTFYISRRARDPVTGVLALECYDALLKANALWEPSAGDWPRAMSAVVAELAALLGLALDSRTAIPSGAAYTISEPAAGTTIRDVLGTIAQAAGGSWVVTPEDRLRLVPLLDASEAVEATTDAVDVDGVVGGMDVGQAGAVTGVRDSWEGDVYLTGDDTGIVVDVSLPPVIAAELADALVGIGYQPFSLSGAVVDPAIEIGDCVRAGAGGEVASVLYSARMLLGPACRGDLAAPQPGELTDEYPYIGGRDRTLALARAAATQAVEALDDELTQQEIFNRLTDNGAAQGLVLLNGQLYVNATYLRGGTIDGDFVNAKLLNIVDADGNVIASFDDTITMGKSNSGRVNIDYNSFDVIDKDGNVYMSTGDMRGNDGYATVYESRAVESNGGQILKSFPLTVREIVRVTVNGIDRTSYAIINRSGNYIYVNLSLSAGDVIEYWYKTDDPVYQMTNGTRANEAGPYTVALGSDITASGIYAVGIGNSTIATQEASFASGNSTEASAPYSSTFGNNTIANHLSQHVFGEYNIADTNTRFWTKRGDYVEIVGNGTENARSNARTLDWNGNEWIAGALSVGDAATTRANLGITPANIGALPDTTTAADIGAVQNINIVNADIANAAALNAKLSQIPYSTSPSLRGAAIAYVPQQVMRAITGVATANGGFGYIVRNGTSSFMFNVTSINGNVIYVFSLTSTESEYSHGTVYQYTGTAV